MKALCVFASQYGGYPSGSAWQHMAECDATDFVFIPKAYPQTAGAADEMAYAINSLLSARGSKTTKVWIGTPGIDSNNFNSGYTASMLTSFLTNVYNELAYKSKVAGTYMNQEAIYGGMDFNNVLNGTQPGNRQIRIMNEIRTFVKSGKIGGTQFIWCPYYGSGTSAATIIKKIGHVADKVNIFDTVFLQPHTMFEPDKCVGNLNGVKYSVTANQICYRDNTKVIASKASSTQIGYEMEYAPRMSGFAGLWADYKNAFSSCKSKPCLFYWEGNTEATFNEVTAWF